SFTLLLAPPPPPTSPLFPYTTLFRSVLPSRSTEATQPERQSYCRTPDMILRALTRTWFPEPCTPSTCGAKYTCCCIEGTRLQRRDRKSTRLNSSHRTISYAVFCLKKK